MQIRAKIISSITLSIVWALLFTIPVFAETEIEVIENPLKYEASLDKHEISFQEKTEIRIQLELPEHYRAYLDMFKLQLADKTQGVLSPFEVSPIFEFDDKISGKRKKGIEEEALMTATFKPSSSLKNGTNLIPLILTYQACTDDFCLLPKKVNLEVELRVSGGKAEGPSFDVTSNSAFIAAMEKGLFFAFLFVFFAGFLTSLTPCVFPMIPITLSVIGAQSVGQSRFKSFLLSLTYVHGIAFTYSILGVIAAKTGALFGSALANPIIVTTIAVLFALMGLSMYGLFEIQVPAFVRNKFAKAKTNPGFVGSFASGLIAGVVASPCVGPVLVGVLAYVAQTGSVVLGFFLLFTFAMGLGVLFIALGTFSQLINRLPRAGGWMDGIKFIFGTTMIAMALYFVEPLMDERLFFSLTGVICVLIASGFGVFRPAKSSAPQQIKKGLLITLFVLGLSFLVNGIFHEEIGAIRAGSTAGKSEDTKSAMKWENYSDARRNEAIAMKMPVIIDFTADWCAACKELERYTFTDPRVQSLSTEFVLLRVDATLETEKNKRLLEYFGVIGLPTLLFYGPDGELNPDLTLTGFESAKKFLKRMEKAKSSF